MDLQIFIDCCMPQRMIQRFDCWLINGITIIVKISNVGMMIKLLL